MFNDDDNGPNHITPFIVASVIGISLVFWFFQSVQNKFRPRRVVWLIFLSHSCVFADLLLRGSLSPINFASKTVTVISASLVTIGGRSLIMSNYIFLTELFEKKSNISTGIRLGAIFGALLSTILGMASGFEAINPDHLTTSYHLRQASSAIVLFMSVAFFIVWFVVRSKLNRSVLAWTLMIISNISCMIVAIFVLIASIPEYYLRINKSELWFYLFEIAPIALTHVTWSILHPKRSLLISTSVSTDDQVIL